MGLGRGPGFASKVADQAVEQFAVLVRVLPIAAVRDVLVDDIGPAWMIPFGLMIVDRVRAHKNACLPISQVDTVLL